MKTTSHSIKLVQPAQGFTITLEQVGSNVIGTGSGAINLTGLTFLNSNTQLSGVIASSGLLNTGPTGGVVVDVYIGATGPTSFGSGGPVLCQ